MKAQLTRLMKSIIRLHPLLEDPELREAYLSCEEAMKSKPKGKCLMRNSGVTVDDVRGAFVDDLERADAKHYYNVALDWSDGNSQMRVNWVSVIRNMARGDLAKGKMKLSNFAQGTVTAATKEYNPAPLPKGSPMPDSLKKHIANIGKE